MTKRALSAVAGFLTLCLSLSAQATDPTDSFSALNNPTLRLPPLTITDSTSFSFTNAFTQVGTTAPPDVLLPALIVTQPRRVATVSGASSQDSSKEVVPVRRPYFDYAGGEMGVLYGSSSGKFGREFEQGYIIGEVGNDKLQMSAGAFYEHSSGRVQRFGR